MKFYLLILTSVMFAFNSCNNNEAATKTQTPKGIAINVSGYTRVISGIGADIDIEVNPDSPYYCYLQCDKKSETALLFNIVNDELQISTTENSIFNSSKPIHIQMRVQELKSVSGKGSGNMMVNGVVKSAKFDIENKGSNAITINDLETDELEIESNGSGNVMINGNAKTLTAKILGSGDLKAYGLKTENAVTKITGSGSMEVSVKDNLDADIVGSGNIFYKGSPVIRKNITGSGVLSAK